MLPLNQLVCHNFELVAAAALMLGGWDTSCIAKRLHWKKWCSLCHFACFTAVPVYVLLIQILYYKANYNTDVLLYCIEYLIIFFLSHYVLTMSVVSNKSSRSEGDIYSTSCTFFICLFFFLIHSVWALCKVVPLLSFVIAHRVTNFSLWMPRFHTSAVSVRWYQISLYCQFLGFTLLADAVSSGTVSPTADGCFTILYSESFGPQYQVSLLYPTHQYEPKMITHHLFIAEPKYQML